MKQRVGLFVAKTCFDLTAAKNVSRVRLKIVSWLYGKGYGKDEVDKYLGTFGKDLLEGRPIAWIYLRRWYAVMIAKGAPELRWVAHKRLVDSGFEVSG